MANACTFICGDDEFIVTQRGKQIFEEKSAACLDDFSKEILDGFAQKIENVISIAGLLQQSTQTMSLFGGKKAVWLKGVNFLSDKGPGSTEGAKESIADMQKIIGSLSSEAVDLIITACPVDRRRREFKWFQENTEFVDLKDEGRKGVVSLVNAECATFKVKISSGTLEALLSKVDATGGKNIRVVIEEIRKLATYVGAGGEINEQHVMELVPQFGEGDFFETTEAFFSFDLDWTLDSLKRHFFLYTDARGIISSLQNFNRSLIQLRSLIDGGAISIGSNGISKGEFEAAARVYSIHFGGLDDKNSYNIFTQNLWYLGNKIGPAANKLPLRKLIDFQVEFTRAFEAIIARPNEQHAVMNELAIRCLS
jgi:DNA polymerase III subunit delta